MTGKHVEHIHALTLGDLSKEWKDRYGCLPHNIPATLLRRLLAWRAQADEAGGFDKATIALLQRSEAPKPPLVPPGAVVTREWKGVRHQVEALEDGFLYDGKRWGSLSQIARAITGTRWSGPRFFGLPQRKR